MSPSTYQFDQLDSCHFRMEKRRFRYLRYALYNATKYVCHLDKYLGAYFAKNHSEGKHYNVALSRAVKKLELFLQWKNQDNPTLHPFSSFYNHFLFRSPVKTLLFSYSFQGTDCNKKSLPHFQNSFFT